MGPVDQLNQDRARRRPKSLDRRRPPVSASTGLLQVNPPPHEVTSIVVKPVLPADGPHQEA